MDFKNKCWNNLGTAPAYFCGIATINFFSYVTWGFFFCIEIHAKHKVKEIMEEKHEKWCIQCHKMQHKPEKGVCFEAFGGSNS